LGSAANLAKNIILDLNNWANGWVFWNLILDQENGPRHAGGLHGSNIVNADLTTGKVTYNPPHYVFGHFSRFIKRGARRIACTSSNDQLIATAFINPDGNISAVTHNLSDNEVMFQLWIEGKVLKSTLPARGTMTMVGLIIPFHSRCSSYDKGFSFRNAFILTIKLSKCIQNPDASISYTSLSRLIFLLPIPIHVYELIECFMMRYLTSPQLLHSSLTSLGEINLRVTSERVRIVLVQL
jgi:hypothetical protein